MIEISSPHTYTTTKSQWSEDDGEEEEMTQRTYYSRTNHAGDELIEEKGENVVRVYFQNLNGLKWDKYGGIWPMACQSMAAIQADILGFAEVNQDTSNYDIKRQLEAVAAKQFGQMRLIAATSNRAVRKTFKPGGTMMLTTNSMAKWIHETSRDRMGRWVTTRYRGENNQKLSVIMAYQVCQHKRTGHNTAVNQQINMILEEAVANGIHTRLNPREAFINDLIHFIRTRQQDGDKIILIGDFNETMTDPNSGISRLFFAGCVRIKIRHCISSTNIQKKRPTHRLRRDVPRNLRRRDSNGIRTFRL
jgi:exonuclease III